MKMKKLTVAVFAVVLLTLFASYMVNLILLRDDYAEESFPKPTFSSVIQGDYQSEANEALSKRALFEPFWIRCKTDIELISGKREINEVYFADNSLIDKPTLPDDKSCASVAEVFNEIASYAKGKTYALFLPTAAYIQSDKLPEYAPKEDQSAIVSRLQARLSGNITVLDAITPLTSVKNSRIYYNTDPKITGYGAFTVYNYNMKSMGFQPATLNEFNIEYGTRDFYGELYDRTSYSKVSPDRVELYHYNTQSFPIKVYNISEDGTTERDELYDRSLLQTEKSDLALFGKESDYKRVTSETRGNKKLLVFADENFAPFVQFFALHYGQIDVIDINYIDQDTVKVVPSEYDDMLFCLSLETINQSEQISKALEICKQGDLL